MSPEHLLDALTDAVLARRRLPWTRVAVDGVDGAGKTTLADALGELLERLGVPVVRASVDGFHRPRAQRWRLGRDSPVGFFRDSYDYPALRRVLLDPLGPGGDGRHRRAVRVVDTDVAVCAPCEQAPAGAVLVLDGVFLHRDELAGRWDWSVFLQARFEVTVGRMARRDGCPPDPGHPANRR